jgi:aspartyl-tRNA(Asn)/glutamyl-tRNA(Gln) amidotransferase subunit C
LTIELDDNGNLIKDAFNYEKDFLNYLEKNLSKFDVTYLGHELVETKVGDLTIVFRFTYNSKSKILSSHYIKELAADIMLDLTEKEIQDIKKTENSIREKFLKVLTIDTDHVKPMYFPIDDVHYYLREDNSYHVANQQDVLANAPTKDGDYITIVKVVK